MKAAILAMVPVFFSGLPVLSQELVMADPTAVRDIARRHGAASLSTTDDGSPMITGRISGLAYAIFFDSCAGGAVCRDLRLFAVFAGNRPSAEVMNEWNRDKRWSKAYVDGDLDATIELDVNMVAGVALETLDDTLATWALTLREFATFIGAD